MHWRNLLSALVTDKVGLSYSTQGAHHETTRECTLLYTEIENLEKIQSFEKRLDTNIAKTMLALPKLKIMLNSFAGFTSWSRA